MLVTYCIYFFSSIVIVFGWFVISLRENLQKRWPFDRRCGCNSRRMLKKKTQPRLKHSKPTPFEHYLTTWCISRHKKISTFRKLWILITYMPIRQTKKKVRILELIVHKFECMNIIFLISRKEGGGLSDVGANKPFFQDLLDLGWCRRQFYTTKQLLVTSNPNANYRLFLLLWQSRALQKNPEHYMVNYFELASNGRHVSVLFSSTLIPMMWQLKTVKLRVTQMLPSWWLLALVFRFSRRYIWDFSLIISLYEDQHRYIWNLFFQSIYLNSSKCCRHN